MFRVELAYIRGVSRLVLVGVLGSLAAACSSDTMRFAENPFTNPFSRGSSETTGSISAPPPAAAPVSGVQSQPLPPMGSVTSQPLPPAATPSSRAGAWTGAPVTGNVAGWTAQGGSTVVLAQGETLRTLSDRYGIPEPAIRQVNNLGSSQPAPGTRVILPVYHANGATAASTPSTGKPGQPRLQFTPGKSAATETPVKTATKPEQARTTVATSTKPAEAKATEVKTAAVEAKPAAVKAAPVKPVQTAEVETKAEPAKPAATPQPSAYAPAATAVESTGSISKADVVEFRWPARGRVISGFGTQNGTGNDGINISLPEGTPVKAAEGGTVAYAGNELKGYGNLVLIKHDNGWVSAYAHNGEIKVRRGEQVKRGQVIATSGQTGNVQSPQLHFELRKGSTPVDPMPHLSGG
jgi:murein DD-endopeptidase MepM/ murein hydrolase activator NlpD